MTDRPALTVTEAAEASGTSRTTIRRRLDGGEFPDAYRDAQDRWRIPVDNLLAAGFVLGRPSAGPEPSEDRPPDADRLHELEVQLAALRAEVDGLRREREVLRELVDTQRMAFRALMPGDPTPDADTSTDGPQHAPERDGTGWLRRLTRGG